MAVHSFCSNCGRPLADSGVCESCSPGAVGAVASAAALSPAAVYEAPVASDGTVTIRQSFAEPVRVLAGDGSADSRFAYGGRPTGPPDLARYSGMWNWGAFLLCPFWLMNHGAFPLGILALVLSFVPLVNLVSSLGFGIFFGIKGNDWAASHRAFASDAQFVAVQNAWRNWGIGLALLGVAFTIAAIVLAGVAHVLSHVVRASA